MPTCFLFSGFSGLVYEVCWIRQASLVFGSTTFAVSTVLAVFFLGLAGGSYVFGRVARGSARPLRLYAIIEIVLGLFALLSLYAFGLVEQLYGELYRAFAGRSVLLFSARVVLVSLIILPPSFLMGATLPLFCRQYVVERRRIASSVGLLYGLNTLGAALGCAIAGLVLIPALGILRAVQLAAALNILCGALVASLAITALPPATTQPSALREGPRGVVIAWLFFEVGFVALAS